MVADRKVESYHRRSRSLVTPRERFDTRPVCLDRIPQDCGETFRPSMIAQLRHHFGHDQQHAGIISAHRRVLLQKSSQKFCQRTNCELDVGFDVLQRAVIGGPTASTEHILFWRVHF